MAYTGKPEQAVVSARKALQRMQREGITPDPENYTVWFNYYSGAHADLTRAVDALAESKAALTDARSAELFERFFGLEHESRRLQDTSRALETALDQILAELDRASGDTDRFNRSLDDFSNALGAELDLDRLRRAVATIAAETRTLIAQNNQFSARMGATNKELARLRGDLETEQRKAMTDGLTGIANRRSFDQALRAQTEAARAGGEPLCLVLADIDHFKKINDTYGHQRGDEVLKVVAKIIRDSVKGRDTAARFGGEEFAILLPATDLDGAVKVSSQIRTALAKRKLVWRATGETLGAVTLSFGATRYAPGEPVSALLGRADAALYAAKQAGRNRLEVQLPPAEGDPPAPP